MSESHLIQFQFNLMKLLEIIYSLNVKFSTYYLEPYDLFYFIFYYISETEKATIWLETEVEL